MKQQKAKVHLQKPHQVPSKSQISFPIQGDTVKKGTFFSTKPQKKSILSPQILIFTIIWF